MLLAASRNLGFAFVGREDLLRGRDILPPLIHVCACQPGAALAADMEWSLEPVFQSPLLSMNEGD